MTHPAILEALLSLLITCAGFAIPFVVRAVVRWFETKTRIDVSDAREAAIERAIARAIAWAEEQGHKALKAKISDESTNGSMPVEATSDGKLRAAVDVAKGELAAHDIDIDESEIKRLVESYVNLRRMN